MEIEKQLDRFSEDMISRHVISEKEAEDIKHVSDLFILAAQQDTPEPSLVYSAYRDDMAEEMYEILSMWIDWLRFSRQK